MKYDMHWVEAMKDGMHWAMRAERLRQMLKAMVEGVEELCEHAQMEEAFATALLGETKRMRAALEKIHEMCLAADESVCECNECNQCLARAALAAPEVRP